MESFNGRFRDECLNEHLFSSLAAARRIIEAWRIDHNTERPHTSLNGLTPAAFATRPTQRHRENGLCLRTRARRGQGHSRAGRGVALEVELLVLGRDTGIADEHAGAGIRRGKRCAVSCRKAYAILAAAR